MMLLPVAAPDPSGLSLAQDGELVFPTWHTPGEPECRCHRTFAGLTTHHSTTRAIIRDVPMDFSTLRETVVRSLERGGWAHSPDLDDRVTEVAFEMIQIGECFAEGTVLMRDEFDVLPVG